MSGDQIFTSQPHGSHLLSLFLLPTGITSYTSHVLQPLTEWSPFLYSSGSVCILTFSIHPCLNCSNILAHVPVPIFIHTEPEYLLKCKFCLVLPLPEILNDSPGHARKKKKDTRCSPRAGLPSSQLSSYHGHFHPTTTPTATSFPESIKLILASVPYYPVYLLSTSPQWASRVGTSLSLFLTSPGTVFSSCEPPLCLWDFLQQLVL